MAVLARLSRTIPLAIVLAILAGIVYGAVLYKSSPNRAKEVLIKLFTWLMGGLTAIFVLLALYAVGEGNIAVTELWATFAAVTLVGFGITFLCRWRFVKNHPNYKEEASSKAKVIPNRPWPFNMFKFPWER